MLNLVFQRSTIIEREIDTEFKQYWARLSSEQKKSLLNIAKIFIGAYDQTSTPEIKEKLIVEERKRYFAGCSQSCSWAVVKSMALNKNERAT
jgi:hypothetical protein